MDCAGSADDPLALSTEHRQSLKPWLTLRILLALLQRKEQMNDEQALSCAGRLNSP
jgi:hypothetical protein